jgi:UDP-N-acetylglucosamine--N-acetylmuramyl-(pentapeptide) pyrophosphoryl-undecaprenol N-acetylglucosamine transferase
MSTIAIACGGTGGHIYPGITIGEHLRQLGYTVVFTGSNLRMEKDKIPQAGFDFMGVPVRPFNKKKPFRSVLNWWQCSRQAQQFLKQHEVRALVGMGSYITVPAILAAKKLGIPIFLVETNRVPGKANQWLGRLAQWVALAYAETASAFPKTETFVSGSPVRPEFGQIERETGARLFDVDPRFPVLTIIGGSLGAQIINNTVLEALPELLAIENLQVIHVCGASTFDEIRAKAPSSSGQPRYHLLEYVENMPALLATTDVALSRAGASTIAELMVCEVPVILVPGRFGGGHQRDNAQAVEDVGAGFMLEEPEFSPERLVQCVKNVILSTDKQQQMRQNSKQLNTRDAAEHIVHKIVDSI